MQTCDSRRKVLQAGVRGHMSPLFSPAVMTPWCREKIPVEGNFGQLFDQLNVSVDLLSREFSTKLVVQVRTASASCSPALRSSIVLTGSPAGGAAAVRAGGSSAGPELHSGHQTVLPGTDEDHHTDAERPADAAVLHLHLHLHPVSLLLSDIQAIFITTPLCSSSPAGPLSTSDVTGATFVLTTFTSPPTSDWWTPAGERL